MASSKLISAFVFGTLSVVACSKQGPEPESSYSASNDPTLAEAPPPADPVADPAAGGAASAALEPGPIDTTDIAGKPAVGVGGTVAPQPSAAPLTDGQIAKVAETVDLGEIEQSKEAQKRVKNPQVKQLATQLIQHHTKSKQKGQTLVKKADLTPEDSSIATDISTKAEANLLAIKNAEAPADVEKAYVDAQISQHEEVLELLKTRLIPSAINQDLKAQLEQTQKMVEEHIQKARKVRETLTPSGDATASAG
jgi:putative membrane protein